MVDDKSDRFVGANDKVVSGAIYHLTTPINDESWVILGHAMKEKERAISPLIN